MHSHFPSRFCFQRDTSLSPDDTANTLPVTDQETRHTGAGKVFISAADQGPEACDCVQMTTPLSSEQLATMLHGIPVAGAQATSRTQSECRVDESCEFPSSCHSVSPSAHLRRSITFESICRRCLFPFDSTSLMAESCTQVL